MAGINIDAALIIGLVEWWCPEMHTFHLPMGEMTVTLPVEITDTLGTHHGCIRRWTRQSLGGVSGYRTRLSNQEVEELFFLCRVQDVWGLAESKATAYSIWTATGGVHAVGAGQVFFLCVKLRYIWKWFCSSTEIFKYWLIHSQVCFNVLGLWCSGTEVETILIMYLALVQKWRLLIMYLSFLRDLYWTILAWDSALAIYFFILSIELFCSVVKNGLNV